jgi:hypothetical protein
MIKFFPGEEWKPLEAAEGKAKLKYAFSTHGRLASYKEKIEDGKTLKGSLTAGYPAIRVRLKDGTKKLFYVHRLLAQAFLPAPKPEEIIVIHLDHMKENNHLSNLKWATKREKELHQLKSPFYIEGLRKRKEKKTVQGHKLNITQVMKIKKMIFDPERKTKMKAIAKQFNISEMQLYRIKSGENWSHVVLEEDAFKK